jgi:hypothetical protein
MSNIFFHTKSMLLKVTSLGFEYQYIEAWTMFENYALSWLYKKKQ